MQTPSENHSLLFRFLFFCSSHMHISDLDVDPFPIVGFFLPKPPYLSFFLPLPFSFNSRLLSDTFQVFGTSRVTLLDPGRQAAHMLIVFLFPYFPTFLVVLFDGTFLLSIARLVWVVFVAPPKAPLR